MVVGTYFSGLVLCDFVLGMLLACLALAISAASLGNVDLKSDCVLAFSSRHVCPVAIVPIKNWPKAVLQFPGRIRPW